MNEFAMAFVLIFLLCGVFLNAASSYPRENTNVGIFGGHKIAIKNAPYMASLRMMNISEMCVHICGATIIHEQYLLTAAHCCWYSEDLCNVIVGTNEINGEGGEVVEIEKVIKHKGFSFSNGDYDACLIKLTKPLTIGPTVAKITLATPSFKIPHETNLNITGWGKTESGEVSPELLQTEVPKVPLDECKDLYSDVIYMHDLTSRMICAGKPQHGGCNGDSGGPLTYDDVQVGIASFVIHCGSKHPTIFTKVASVFCWIMETIYSSQ